MLASFGRTRGRSYKDRLSAAGQALFLLDPDDKYWGGCRYVAVLDEKLERPTTTKRYKRKKNLGKK